MLLAASLAAAEPLTCPDPMFRVDAPDRAAFNRTCAAAVESRNAVSVCGLVQKDPIYIYLVETPTHPAGACLAAFDGNTHRLEITTPDLLRKKVGADDPYSVLPVTTLFRSLLRHEMAHAVLHQAEEDRKIAMVDHEFVANALEFAGMDANQRETLLQAIGADWEATAGSINIFIYMLEPRKFGATSWKYYAAHGCAPIEGIVAGTFTFHQRP